MRTPEGILQAEIRLALGRERRLVLWRNNRGKAWLGDKYEMLRNRCVLVHNARPVEFGLTNGASDLVGLHQVTITPEMIGRTIAVFSAAEVKRPGVTVPDHQQHFIDFVRGFGGIAGVVRSPDDARRLFEL